MATFDDGLHAAADFLMSLGQRFSHEAEAILKIRDPDGVSDDKIEQAFKLLWEVAWMRDGANPKKPAKIAFHRAVKKRGNDPAKIVEAAKRQAQYYGTRDPRFAPQLATWLNQDRFKDHLWSSGNGGPRDTLFDMDRNMGV